jgi:NADPH-dependent ferric siderophore reductase
MLHWLTDATQTLRTMARATVPGGLVVLQWSCGQPRAEGFALREVTQSVVDRPQWRERLTAAPLNMNQHPLDEVCDLLAAEGLDVLHTQAAVSVPGGEDPGSLRRALRAAAFHAQAEVLGEDADTFIDEVIQALLAARALNPNNVRVIARRPLAFERGRATRPRGAVRAFPLSVGLLEVTGTEQLTPHLRRLVFRTVGADPLPLAEPAETITAIWPAEGAEPVLPEVGRWRFPKDAPHQHTANLTVRGYDPAAARLTVDFYLHGEHGLAARWAAAAAPGDRVGFGGSRVHWVHDPSADWTLLLGDETVLPSVAAIAETLPADKPVLAVLESGDEADRAYLDTARLQVHWTGRDGLEAAVRDLALPAGRGQVFGGAESLVIQRIRRHLLGERGLGRDEVSVQGYWHHQRER